MEMLSGGIMWLLLSTAIMWRLRKVIGFDDSSGLRGICPLEHVIHFLEVVCSARNRRRVTFGLVAFLEMSLLPELAHLKAD